MDSFFFKVEHELLRSESFKTLGGSAIKVYLVVGLYADFGTGWAYPGIRTIAKQAGLSRQTVLAAVEDLTRVGLLATSKAKGKSTAYQVLRPAPGRPGAKKRIDPSQNSALTGPNFCEVTSETVPVSLAPAALTVPNPLEPVAQFFGPSGHENRPQTRTRNKRRQRNHPDSGNPLPDNDGRSPGCCCELTRITDGTGNSTAPRRATLGSKSSRGRRESFAQRALFAESRQTTKRSRIHSEGDRRWIRPTSPSGEPSGKSAEGIRDSNKKRRRETGKIAERSCARSRKRGNRTCD